MDDSYSVQTFFYDDIAGTVESWHDINDRFHRIDGPALKNEVLEIWYYHGKVHRLKDLGPAKVWQDGYKEWYHFDELHRLTGPAVKLPIR